MAYTDLADFFLREGKLIEAESVLNRGLEALGGMDLSIQERLEEVLMRKAHEQYAVADQRAQELESEEAIELARRMKNHSNQVELEVFAARSGRDPQNARLKLELGLRMKRAGRFKEAITPLQAARPLESRRGEVLLMLGECFHRIEQYKLALSSYEESAAAANQNDPQTHKLALYRAGVLCMGLRELDRAEKHLTDLAGIDFGYKDTSERLDKIALLRKNM